MIFSSVCWDFIVYQIFFCQCPSLCFLPIFQAYQLIGKTPRPYFSVLVAVNEVSIFYGFSCFIINYGVSQDNEILAVCNLWRCGMSMIYNVPWSNRVVYFSYPFFAWWGICVPPEEWSLLGLLPPLVVRTHCTRMRSGLVVVVVMIFPFSSLRFCYC